MSNSLIFFPFELLLMQNLVQRIVIIYCLLNLFRSRL